MNYESWLIYTDMDDLAEAVNAISTYIQHPADESPLQRAGRIVLNCLDFSVPVPDFHELMCEDESMHLWWALGLIASAAPSISSRQLWLTSAHAHLLSYYKKKLEEK